MINKMFVINDLRYELKKSQKESTKLLAKIELLKEQLSTLKAELTK